METDIGRAKAAQNLGLSLEICTAAGSLEWKEWSLVKSATTFSLPAWNPSTEQNTSKLEHMQKKAKRFSRRRANKPYHAGANASATHTNFPTWCSWKILKRRHRLWCPCADHWGLRGEISRAKTPATIGCSRPQRNTPMDGSPLALSSDPAQRLFGGQIFALLQRSNECKEC